MGVGAPGPNTGVRYNIFRRVGTVVRGNLSTTEINVYVNNVLCVVRCRSSDVREKY